jgi:hypothetical protein
MAALPPVRRIFKEDLGPDVPDWISRLLAPLNLVLQSIYTALNHAITFQENIQCQVKEFNLIAGVAATNNTYDFMLTLPTKPTGLWLVAALRTDGTAETFTAGVFASWTWDSAAGTIRISGITGLTSTKQYLLRVIVI